MRLTLPTATPRRDRRSRTPCPRKPYEIGDLAGLVAARSGEEVAEETADGVDLDEEAVVAVRRGDHLQRNPEGIGDLLLLRDRVQPVAVHAGHDHPCRDGRQRRLHPT